MAEQYRRAKVFMHAYIDVLVNDSETAEEQEQKAVDLAIDFVHCLSDPDIEFDLVELN